MKWVVLNQLIIPKYGLIEIYFGLLPSRSRGVPRAMGNFAKVCCQLYLINFHSCAILLVDILVVVSDAEVGIGLLQRIVRTEQWFAVADWGIIARILPGDTQIGG